MLEMFHTSRLGVVSANQTIILPRSISATTKDHRRRWRSRFSGPFLFLFVDREWLSLTPEEPSSLQGEARKVARSEHWPGRGGLRLGWGLGGREGVARPRKGGFSRRWYKLSLPSRQAAGSARGHKIYRSSFQHAIEE